MENILEQIKAECEKKMCKACKLYGVCPFDEIPSKWDIKEIEKRLADGQTT